MRRNASGFTLMEVVIALFLIAVGVIATAPLFVYALQENAGGGDMGTVGAAAVTRMETLRAAAFGTLPAGGSLTSDVNGYSDFSVPEVVVRWTIADNPNPAIPSKTITVEAIAIGESIGRRKSVTMVTVRGG
jgi:prepilin-type N-terminal cleavage/methylation domain-containing protein